MYTCVCRWTRISIPLPNAALTESTQFRWIQTGIGIDNMWAIDNGEGHNLILKCNTKMLKHAHAYTRTHIIHTQGCEKVQVGPFLIFIYFFAL